MKPLRIAVLSASVGAGHIRAAEAVTAAARELLPEATVENRDLLELTNPLFRRVYGKAYLDMVNKAPHLLGYFYDQLDRESRSGHKFTDRMRIAIDKLNLRPFEEWFLGRNWDLVINTHFLPAEIVARLRTQGDVRVPQTTVCTDFETHRLWVNQPCERYFGATEEGVIHLRHWGVPDADIRITGIPVVPPFAVPADRAACLKSQGLEGDRPVVLQLCGGFGVGPVEQVFRGILEAATPIDLVVVCGRNSKLKTALHKLPFPDRHRVHLIGLTHEMDKLMGCADVVVSKPGGLTTSEILAREVPFVVINPIPGQETRNSDYLLENGAALKANNLSALSYKVSMLLDDSARRERMRAAARAIANPRAAYDVVQSSLELVK